MAFMKQVEGAVFADLDLMFQGDRVTATIHNIYYMEYARDRYGKFSPKTSKKYTLEELNKKKARDSRKKHLQTIDKNMRMLLTNLHQTLSEIKSASIH
jgi:G:T-mismatch repair DNA endonuclease (very short patch repair protein)